MIRQLTVALMVATPMVTLDVATAHAHTPPPAAPAATTSASYTVRAGDGFSSIARKLGVKLSDLLAVNKLTISSTIHPGQLLAVPASNSPTPTTPPASTPTSQTSTAGTSPYAVKSGDSLFAIARRHGVTLNALLVANSFTVNSTILPGQVIRIPANNSPTTTPPSTQAPVTNAPVDTLITYLRQQVGKPYKFFTAGPDTFDCSGLVVAGYHQIGVTLPHQSRMQSTIGTEVDWRAEPIEAGDLIFMVSSIDPTRIGHVGIALDSSTWIQAVAPDIPVRIRPIPNADKISAVRRIVGA